MKKRLICLFLCILMIVPVCLMAACADKTDEEANADMQEEASEATVTLTMYLMSEQEVCTVEELAAIKSTYGDTSKEYKDAKAVYDAHKNVEIAMNKITKAKFKTQVNVFWLTPDEYYEVIEAKMEGFEEETKLKDSAKKAWDKFKKEQIELGLTNEFEIKALFDAKYPDYAEFIKVVDPDETTVETEEETIKSESGIVELKYPDAGKNQVDIIYIGGYDLYQTYIEKEWIQNLDGELKSTAKSLSAYINAAFFDAMSVTPDGGIYAVPTNGTIGEYTYMLLSKELYDEFYGYYGLIDDIQTEITSIADVYDFIEEVGESEYLSDWVPFTGSLQTSGTHFWSIDYEYVLQEGLSKFESGKAYYTKDESGAYSQVGKYIDGVQYFVQDSATNHYVAHTGENLDPETEYFVLGSAAYARAKEFVAGVTYFTKDTAGNYIVAKDINSFEDGVEYYKISNRQYTKIKTSDYSVSEGVLIYVKQDDEYVLATDLAEFDSDTSYYVVRDRDDEKTSDKHSYTKYGVFESGVEYYIADIVFTSDEFSMIGSAIEEDADEKTKIKFENVFTGELDYADQLLAIKKIEENGFYDPDALANGKKFAAAIVKGGAEVAAKYSEDYFAVVLNAPTADFTKMYDHMYAVPTASVNLSRAMEVITLLNTDSEFRNLVQYGIEGENYNLETVKINGKEYKSVERINGSRYVMDINKTGNLFVAYPEEGMSPDIWEYAKIQNRDSRRAPLSKFDINELTSPDLELLIEVEKISAEWQAKIDACKTSEELQAVIDEIKLKTETDATLKRLINPAEDDARSLNTIYNEWYKDTYEAKK